MNLITKGKIFRIELCYMYTIEWQKRGLPHVRILVWLQETLHVHKVDDFISAETPNPEEDPKLFSCITTQMIYGPCRVINPFSSYVYLYSFCDEAHFWLNGYFNKQNCRIWSEANPQVYVETPLHPEKLTVWCALWAGGIIGAYFFKNDEGHNVTVNGDRYRAMITNFFIPELNNHDVQELWFQQDCATCHTACATIDLLKDTFGDRLISRFGPVNWPPRSCDLTPLDYFLWAM
ncbi:uncharacterized protein TNCV_2075391 [Trichonephila clavipes]|nr:uncharacterized protein TNCV_2075391 [Trichonephila clavipes]